MNAYSVSKLAKDARDGDREACLNLVDCTAPPSLDDFIGRFVPRHRHQELFDLFADCYREWADGLVLAGLEEQCADIQIPEEAM